MFISSINNIGMMLHASARHLPGEYHGSKTLPIQRKALSKSLSRVLSMTFVLLWRQIISVGAFVPVTLYSRRLPVRLLNLNAPAISRRLFSNGSNQSQDSSAVSNQNGTAGSAFPHLTDDMQKVSINGLTPSSGANNTLPTASFAPSVATLVSSVLAIDPAEIEIITTESSEDPVIPDASEMLRRLPFVSMFRGSANYIANHRNTIAVYHIPGGLLDIPDPAVFQNIMNDIALTWLLGMKVILVVGCRHQIEKRMKKNGVLEESHRVAGLRVTDKDILRIVKEEAGYVRFEVERQLARSLRMQGTAWTGGITDGNVVSGNFYSAQPFGILDGVDYQ